MFLVLTKGNIELAGSVELHGRTEHLSAGVVHTTLSQAPLSIEMSCFHFSSEAAFFHGDRRPISD